VTVSEARRLLRECPADIIISNQDMPETSGREFLSEMAHAHPASHRMLLTGMIHVGEAIPEIHSGLIQSLIPKPWTEIHIRQVLDRATLQGQTTLSRRT
jgi:response regulator RpfG family c-di-GMP phosphodiesterase